MEYMTDIEETKVKAAVEEAFPGHYVSFMEDPDDSSVVLVRLYDIEVSDIGESKAKLRDVLRNKVGTLRADLVPSIVSHENTRKYYAEYLRREVLIDDSALKLLVEMKYRPNYCSIEPDNVPEWNNASFLSTDIGAIHVRECSRIAA